jgi:hypothetical protein
MNNIKVDEDGCGVDIDELQKIADEHTDCSFIVKHYKLLVLGEAEAVLRFLVSLLNGQRTVGSSSRLIEVVYCTSSCATE